MAMIEIKDFSFSYSMGKEKALKNVNLKIDTGDFVLVCGKSGCGKSTLLRNLKPSLAPYGDKNGKIFIEGREISEFSERDIAEKIGFVLQDPDAQTVTDKVWHELAFGLENLGFKTPEIRARVAEMASFFGIEKWFHKKIEDLSGGQKQLLNLASVMAIRPEIIILDEPTSQLDPIAASEFLQSLYKINKELGVAIVLSEQRLEEVFTMVNKVVVLDGGEIVTCDTPERAGEILKETKNSMFKALPVSMRVYGEVENGSKYPINIAEGRRWLKEFLKGENMRINPLEQPERGEDALKIKDVFFRHEKDLPYVISGLSATIKKGELYALLGGNGVGKSTLISVICGEKKATRGKVVSKGLKIGVLPQNPEALFMEKTVESELGGREEIINLCRLERLLERHPYDLSGGEKQRLALAKILAAEPDILLLDEPTKGMDAEFKEEFYKILKKLMEKGVSVFMVSHDIEFCARYADRCGLMFDGEIVSEGAPREFFGGNSFYTTGAARMSRGIIDGGILDTDIISVCKGEKYEEK